MKNRAVEIAEFLAQAGWDGAAQTPLQADFSTRHFTRLERGKDRAILMDAETGQNTAQFVTIAKILRPLDISAPEIFFENAPQGLVLIEDFGDRNVGRLIDAGAEAKPFYHRAADVLVRLHRKFEINEINLPQRSPQEGRGALDLPVFNSALFASQVELFLDAYFVFVKKREATSGEAEGFRAAWKEALKGMEVLPQTLMLRDFMPDNLMALDRPDWRGIGVLDFQDGGIGPAAYDLASLCEVVRRDCGGEAMLDEMIDYYHVRAAPSLSKTELRSACRVLAAQRHMRILGIVARLATKGRKEKLVYFPRINTYLNALLKDDALKHVWGWVKENKLI